MRLIKWPEFGEGGRRREWGKEKIRIRYIVLFASKLILVIAIIIKKIMNNLIL
jgi:hypothetical protein